MADIMRNLPTFQPGYGIGTNEPLLQLRHRAKGLMVNACAHALFCCKLLNATKYQGQSPKDVTPGFQTFRDHQKLKIGIIGGGHLGKQLARTLLHLGDISESNLQISTRRPETLSEFQMLGVRCVYNNKQVVGWADVIFLCCLPCHIPHICSEVQDSLNSSCIIYSMVTAIPLPRLKQLLASTSILRPYYKFSDSSTFYMWEANKAVVEALQDSEVIQATCPCNSNSEIVGSMKWLAAVFYAALNSYSQQHFSYEKALGLLNQVCFFKSSATSQSPSLLCEHFINQAFASSLAPDDSFPRFDLTVVQLKDSPFSQLLATNAFFRETIASSYCNMITVLLAKTEDFMTKKVPVSAVLLRPTRNLYLQSDKICTSKVEKTSSIYSEKS